MEKAFERLIFASRWLMAPMYLGLVAVLGMMLAVFLRQTFYYVPQALTMSAETAILARLVTAEAAVAVMNDVDQALGAASFATTHPVDRIRRDLSFYIRQADPDGLGHAATERILASPALRQRWLA